MAESGRVAGSAPADPDPESGQTRPESGGVGLVNQSRLSRGWVGVPPPESGRQGPTRLRVGRLGAESADSAIHDEHNYTTINRNHFSLPFSHIPACSSLRQRHFCNCSTESLRWPAVGKYKVDVESFESLALPELQVKEDTELFIIDEVGKMELYSSSFFPAVLRVLESGIPLLASIPIPKAGRDIPAVARLRNHPGAAVYLLNPGNRDAIKEQVYSQLVNLLPKH
ncbi:hypothetical protein Taro_019089 [Colocasia esculenta]|uniref:Nucleoside-triphosphatase THEP1 n=1 Tax=Colocasia esculenta TaxID=4460 RepID=A0A843UK99_COLES|nr:hypothetical protein [Colocasia esculenta]